MFKKKITALIISAALALTGVTASGLTHLASGKVTSAIAAETDEDNDEVRGIWLSIYDYSNNVGGVACKRENFEIANGCRPRK